MKSKLTKAQIAAVIDKVREIAERAEVRIDIESFREDLLFSLLAAELPDLEVEEPPLWNVYYRGDSSDVWRTYMRLISDAAATQIEADLKLMSYQTKREVSAGL